MFDEFYIPLWILNLIEIKGVKKKAASMKMVLYVKVIPTLQ